MNTFLLLKYFQWHFFEATWNLVRAWGNILWFNYNFFSLGILLRTYFSPWRRISWDYGRGFSIGRFVNVLTSNLTSRFLGAIMRSFLIVMGVIVQLILFVLALFTFAFWLFLPAIIMLSIFYGFFLLF